MTAASSPISIRGETRAARSAKAPLPRPEGTTFVPRWQAPGAPVPRSSPRSAVPAPRDVLEKDALDGILVAVGEDLVGRGLDQAGAHRRHYFRLKP